MSINRGLWVPIDAGNVGTTELEARLADVALFESNDGENVRSGVLGWANAAGATIVTGASGMSYSLASGLTFVVSRSAGEGVYRFSSSGSTTVATTEAPVANSRIDVIYVRQNDQSKGDPDNRAVLGVVQGTAAAFPAAPALPAGALELARATVASGVTRTDAASITQTWRHAALRGTPIPVRGDAERAEITSPRTGQQVRRVDAAGGRVVETWGGAAWERTPLVKSSTAPQTVTTNSLGYSTVVYPTAFPTATDSFAVMEADDTMGSVTLKSISSTPGGINFRAFASNGQPILNTPIRVTWIAVGR